MIQKEQILSENLTVYIYVGDNKEGTPQFRKVRHPEKVDVAAGHVQMWVEDTLLDPHNTSLNPVVVDPKNLPEQPPEIAIEAALRAYTGHVILFDATGKKIDETPVEPKDDI